MKNTLLLQGMFREIKRKASALRWEALRLERKSKLEASEVNLLFAFNANLQAVSDNIKKQLVRPHGKKR